MSILDWGPLSRVRRNHALEHATLQILAQANPGLRMAGYSDPSGFWLVGDVPTEAILAAAQLAVGRLEGGEHSLAIHPNCGTNFVAAGLLAGTLAWLGMLGTGRGMRSKLERWPLVVSLVTIATIMAQPLGPRLQERITTEARLNGLNVVGITRSMRGELPVHHVLTRD
jgi:hypothetical protein